MLKTARIFVFSFFLLLIACFLSLKPAFAQTSQPQADLHNYTQNVMIEVASSLTCMLAGVDPVNPSQKCLGIANGKIGPVDSQGGAIGVMGNLITMTFASPILTKDYIRYLVQNFGLAKNTYASDNPTTGAGGHTQLQQGGEGVGLASLSPLTNIWITFRNMTYLLFILIFIIIGFAIMLRIHIDPRTVMTIENQIPKIIIGLILVTFSFAIIGLMIDLMWVAIYLVASVFQTIPGFDPNNKVPEALGQIQGENAFGAFNNFIGYQDVVTRSAGGIKDLIQSFFSVSASLNNTAGDQNTLFILSGLANILSVAGDLVRNALAGLLGWIGGTLAFLIIGIAVLYSLLKLWFTLIKAYVMILVVTVFSPFWILAGLLPGSKLSFTSLLREVGSNLISFPATLVMFLLAKTFMDVFSKAGDSGIFVPPFIGNPGGETGVKAIGSLIGLGMILLTPDVVKMMRKALQAPDFDFSAIGKAVGAGTGAVTRGGGAILQHSFAPRYVNTPQGMQILYPGGPFGVAARALGLVR